MTANTTEIHGNTGLERALELAMQAHRGQVDLAGEPYMGHIMRVWHNLWVRGESSQAQLLGLVHDVVEDGTFTLQQVTEILRGSEDVVIDDNFQSDLNLLTRIEGQTYAQYTQMVSISERATVVKLADLEDHLNHWSGIPRSLTKRYRQATGVLELALLEFRRGRLKHGIRSTGC